MNFQRHRLRHDSLKPLPKHTSNAVVEVWTPECSEPLDVHIAKAQEAEEFLELLHGDEVLRDIEVVEDMRLLGAF